MWVDVVGNNYPDYPNVELEYGYVTDSAAVGCAGCYNSITSTSNPFYFTTPTDVSCDYGMDWVFTAETTLPDTTVYPSWPTVSVAAGSGDATELDINFGNKASVAEAPYMPADLPENEMTVKITGSLNSILAEIEFDVFNYGLCYQPEAAITGIDDDHFLTDSFEFTLEPTLGGDLIEERSILPLIGGIADPA